MFIDIGNGNVIQTSTIVAMIDYELISSSGLLQEMVNQEKEEENIKGPRRYVKSMVVTTEETYFSTLSIATLKKRTSIKSVIKHIDDYSEYDSHLYDV
ncbi:DUF370 domain-containing protein [Oceanobacillus luteolus]|uniref:Extracellular matrix regulator RemB n=1 Tax=Oceanobacillus luteolus TaxID=1274358 RepID=A0ABW4HNC7_9BACI|nr:extracellular matrix/biofilm biosynthesis regulator RemA family protein [Oceanobacillus luteolus]MCM3740120.1 DUF370 domain-containing protein [Oceanobacillus luteolus]